MERELTEQWGYDKLMSSLREKLGDCQVKHTFFDRV
jgi:hypothetical protein